MRWHRWQTAILAAVAIGLLYWTITPLKPFQVCIQQRQNDQTYQPLREKEFSIVQARLRMRLYLACAVHAADAYQSFIVSLSGVVVALFTGTLWWITRRTVRATEIAAEAARDGIALSRDSFIIENRAYITPVEFGINKMADPRSGTVHTWRLVPHWKNTGQTPAGSIRHLTSGKFFPSHGIPEDFDFPDNQRAEDEHFGRVIGPAFPISGPHCDIDAVIMRDVLKRHRLFVWSWIEYRDVFPGTPIRRTEWCAEVVLAGDPTDGRLSPEGVFRLRQTDRFNGADNDCYRKGGERAPIMAITDLAPKSAGLPRLVMSYRISMPYPGWPDSQA